MVAEGGGRDAKGVAQRGDREAARHPSRGQVVVAITGASGAPYARSLIYELCRRDAFDLSIIVSRAGEMVYEMETGRSVWEERDGGVRVYREDEWTAPFASGSAPLAAMVVVPCSMATLGAIAWGCGRNLIHRVADVCLKETDSYTRSPRDAAAQGASGEYAPLCGSGGSHHAPHAWILPPTVFYGRSRTVRCGAHTRSPWGCS